MDPVTLTNCQQPDTFSPKSVSLWLYVFFVEASQLSEMEMGEDNSITADSSIVTVE